MIECPSYHALILRGPFTFEAKGAVNLFDQFLRDRRFDGNVYVECVYCFPKPLQGGISTDKAELDKVFFPLLTEVLQKRGGNVLEHVSARFFVKPGSSLPGVAFTVVDLEDPEFFQG